MLHKLSGLINLDCLRNVLKLWFQWTR